MLQYLNFSPSPNVAKVVYVKQNMLFKKNMKENNSLSEDEIPIYPLSLFLPEVKGALSKSIATAGIPSNLCITHLKVLVRITKYYSGSDLRGHPLLVFCL